MWQAHSLQYRVHKAGIAVVDKSWRQIRCSFPFLTLFALAVYFLRCELRFRHNRLTAVQRCVYEAEMRYLYSTASYNSKA